MLAESLSPEGLAGCLSTLRCWLGTGGFTGVCRTHGSQRTEICRAPFQELGCCEGERRNRGGVEDRKTSLHLSV